MKNLTSSFRSPNKILSRILPALAAPLRRNMPMVLAITLMLALPPFVLAAATWSPLRKMMLAALAQGFVYAYLAAALTTVTRRWVGVVLMSVAGVLSWLVCQPIIFASQAFSPTTLLLVLETDARETGSFAHQFVTPLKCVGSVLLAAWIAMLPWLCRVAVNWLKIRIKRSIRTAILLLCVPVFIFGAYRLVDLYRNFMVRDLTAFEMWSTRQSTWVPDFFRGTEVSVGDAFTVVPYSLWGLYLNLHQLPEWEAVQRGVIAADIPRSAEADSVNVVVIIGESFIRGHSPLYGYPLDTTPWMTAEADSGRLVHFTDYIAPANLTSVSLRNVLNLNSVGDGEEWYRSAYFPLVARRAGWKVNLFDNQIVKPKYVVDVQLASIVRNPDLSHEFYCLTNDSIDPFDGDFLDRVERKYPFDGTVGNFDIYHLYGQHFAPAERYPLGSRFDRWTGDSLPYDRPWFTPEKRLMVAQYDNATLYNDWVISRIAARYKGTPTIFVYFSDHGEEMYDASDIACRNEPSGDMAGWLGRQFAIPLFIFVNDDYAALRPEVWSRIGQSAARPGMLDNIGQTVLNLAGVTTPLYYRANRDITAPQYACPPRLTVTRRLNFDSICSRVNTGNRGK